MNYRKKQVEIKAMQFTTNCDANSIVAQSIVKWVVDGGGVATTNNTDIYIETLEGTMKATVGDFIINGINGEFYPCKPDVFEKTYDKVEETFDFGLAIKHLKNGKKIARLGWNGTGMFAYYVPANKYKTQTEVAKQSFGTEVQYRDYLALFTAQKDIATWSPSTSDCLADDWIIVD